MQQVETNFTLKNIFSPPHLEVYDRVPKLSFNQKLRKNKSTPNHGSESIMILGSLKASPSRESARSLPGLRAGGGLLWA